MKTIKDYSSFELVEKKSKFICDLFYIQNEEEAKNKLNEIRKKYFDAKHHCFAYRVFDLENSKTIEQFSDDGEPSGTAGGPMLQILQKNDYINVIAIVTRYFGGILLGSGGLVRAYSDAEQGAITHAETYEIEEGIEAIATLKYDEINNFIYLCEKNNIDITKKEYKEEVKLTFETNEEKIKQLKQFSIKVLKKKMIIKQ